jgi:hypothetical protein
LLSVRLEPGQNLDRSLAAASSALKSFTKRAEEAGFSRVVSYPSPEALVAATLVFSYLNRLGLTASVSISPRPPVRVDDPTILLGFNSLNYNNENDKDVLLALGGSIAEPPPLNATYVSVDGSLGASTAMIIRATDEGALSPEYKVLALASSYASKYVDKMGKFSGLDKIYADTLVDDENVSLYMVTYVKSYRPHVLGLCDSLSITLDPLFRSLIGPRQSCVKVIEASGLSKLAEKKASEASEDEVSAIAKAVLMAIRDKLRRQYEVVDFVGGIYVASEKLIITDPREALGLLELSLDLGGLGLAAALVLSYEEEYPQAVASLPLVAERLSGLLEDSKLMDRGTFSGVKVYSVKSDFAPPLYLLWRALKLVGAIQGEQLLLTYEDDRGLRASMLQASEALGASGLLRLVSQEDVEYEGPFIWIPKKSA